MAHLGPCLACTFLIDPVIELAYEGAAATIRLRFLILGCARAQSDDWHQDKPELCRDVTVSEVLYGCLNLPWINLV
jgi:hypothetical protein